MQNGQVALEEFHWPADFAVDPVRGAHIVRFHNSTISHGGETALDIPLSGERFTPAISEIADSCGVPNARSRVTMLRLSREDTGSNERGRA